MTILAARRDLGTTLASTPEAAARERIGGDLAALGRVPVSIVQGRAVSTLGLPTQLLGAVLRQMGVLVIYPPHSSALTIIDPPN